MSRTKKLWISALIFCLAALCALGIYGIRPDRTEVSAENQKTFELLAPSFRYETESDDQSGIRFTVKMDKASYDAYAAYTSGVEMGVLLLPASEKTDEAELTIDTAEVAKAVTLNGEGSKWGDYKENGTAVEGYVSSVVYLHGIPAANYNDAIYARAYVQAGDTIAYSNTVSECVNETAFQALQSETDETKKAQLREYLDANDYTVTFYDGETSLSSSSYKYGDVAVEPDFEKTVTEGNVTKVFDGWYTASEGGEEVTDLTVRKTVAYYAHWETRVETTYELRSFEGVYTLTETQSDDTSVQFTVQLETPFAGGGYAVYQLSTDGSAYSVLEEQDGVYTASKDGGTVFLSSTFDQFQVASDTVSLAGNQTDKPQGAVIVPVAYGADGVVNTNLKWLGYFGENAALTAVAIPKNVIVNPDDSSSGYQFQNCTNLSTVIFEDGSQSSIATQMFAGCTALTSLDLPDGEHIYDSAFTGAGLTSVEIPASVKTMGAYVFKDCASLASVTFEQGGALTEIPAGTFSGTGLTSFTIPAAVTELGEYAFEYSGLTSIEIPATVQTMGAYVFRGCTKMTSVTFAENSSLTAIPEYAFQGCSALLEIEIPEGVTTLGSNAFYSCISITEIVLPSTLTTLAGLEEGNNQSGQWFINCNSLTTLVLNGGMPTIAANANPYDAFSVAMEEDYAPLTIYVPDEYYDDYYNYEYNWSSGNWYFWRGERCEHRTGEGAINYTPKMEPSLGGGLKKISEMPSEEPDPVQDPEEVPVEWPW